MNQRRLVRSRDRRMIAGVCGGIAEWLGWDPVIVRVAYIVVSVLSAGFPGILVYLVLWFVMPEGPRTKPRRFSMNREGEPPVP